MKKRALALFLLLLTITGCKNAPEIRDLSQQTETETSYEKSIAKSNKNQAASLEGLKGISEVKSLKMTLVSL